jgi:hypothetical protein
MASGLRRAAKVVALSLTLAAAGALPAPAQVAVARGRLQHASPNGSFPRGGLKVTLRAQSGIRSTPAYSGNNGMYYVYGVPAGQYTLEVWNPGARAPFLAINIRIAYAARPSGPLFDIPAINVP